MLVLEDLHWGDRGTLALALAALRCSAGPTPPAPRTGTPGGARRLLQTRDEPGLQEIRLSGLGGRAADRLVRAVLPDIGDESARRLVALSEGNAFYLEELIRAHADGQVAKTPTTVIAMVQARLGALEAEDRRLLRAASVFGEVFWRGALATMLGVAPAACAERLDGLVQRELIGRRASARFVGETELAFRHALVREAAYATLTDEDRSFAHRLAAAWLEGAGERDPIPSGPPARRRSRESWP